MEALKESPGVPAGVTDLGRVVHVDARSECSRNCLLSLLLLLEELVGNRKVVAAVAMARHEVVKLVRLGSKSERCLDGVGSIDSETQVLSHEVNTETASVATGRRNVGHDSGDRVVRVRRPAASSRSVEDTSKNGSIHTELDSEVHGLRNAGHLDSQSKVVCELRDLTIARTTAVNDVLAHELQEKRDAIKELGRFRANHERQSSLFSSTNATADGRIKEFGASGQDLGLHCTRCRRVNGRRVNKEHVLQIMALESREEGVSAEISFQGVLGTRKHCNDSFNSRLQHSASRGSVLHQGTSKLSFEGLDGLRTRIVSNHLNLLSSQVFRHTKTHLTQSKESNLLYNM